jgi:internalin A
MKGKWRLIVLAAGLMMLQACGSSRGGNENEKPIISCTKPNQIVNIPDANLKIAIESQLGTSSDPTCAEMQNLTELDAQLSNIQSLVGLQYATNLTELYFNYTQISDLTPLASLTSLTTLDLYGNQIRNLSPLVNLTNLTGLDLGGNWISDLQPLVNLTSHPDLLPVGEGA